MITTGLKWLLLQRNASFNKAFAANLDHSVPVPDLWHAPKACVLQVAVWDLPGAAISVGLIPSKPCFCGRRWYVPKFLHDMDQAEAGVGTWTLKLGSTLRSTILEVMSVLVRQGHSTNAHDKALYTPEQPDRTSESPPSRTPVCANKVESVLALRSPLIQITWQREWKAIQAPLTEATAQI